jgi:DNA-binding GntR family transcriptional regulator
VDLLTDDTIGASQPYRTAQATVVERIRRAVLSGQLRPGSRLRQVVLAANMKLSTTPVREALRELAGEGLLNLDPHRGVVVHQARAEELHEVYGLRMILEPVAIAATIKSITADELNAAERLLTRMERETDVAEWTILNAEFHSVLAEASHQPILMSILRKLRNISALYVAQSLRVDAARLAAGNIEHRAILNACKERNVAIAQEAELVHLRHTLEAGGEKFAYAPAAPEAALRVNQPHLHER